MKFRIFGTALSALALLFSATPAAVHADSTVIVLGLRSLDGDDELARRVSGALRAGASAIDGWNVSRRDVSLAQMSLAHGCEDPTPRCMADVAKTLKVNRLIYGTMLAGRNPRGWVELSLFNFNATTGKVEGTLKERVAAAVMSDSELQERMAAFAAQLAGIAAPGSLLVRGRPPGARVSVDGRPTGSLDAQGQLLVERVPAGTHVVVVESDAGRYEEEVSVSAGKRAELRADISPAAVADLQPDEDLEMDARTKPARDPRQRKRLAGWASLGVAGLGAVGTVIAWLKISSINGNEDLKTYRSAFRPPDDPSGDGVSDVCQEARQGNLTTDIEDRPDLPAKVAKLCDEATPWERSQWALIGLTAVGVGVGSYLLLSTRGSRSVALQPALGPRHAGVRATLRF